MRSYNTVPDLVLHFGTGLSYSSPSLFLVVQLALWYRWYSYQRAIERCSRPLAEVTGHTRWSAPWYGPHFGTGHTLVEATLWNKPHFGTGHTVEQTTLWYRQHFGTGHTDLQLITLRDTGCHPHKRHSTRYLGRYCTH